jgi:hypothetical protein
MIMDTDSVRAPSGQALAVPVEPASGLAPSGFDPSRVEAFVTAVEAFPFISERLARGQQFNCYESGGNDDDDDDEDRSYYFGIGPVTDFAALLGFEDKRKADLFESAFKLAAIATEARRAETTSGSVHEGAARRDRPISGHIGSE